MTQVEAGRLLAYIQALYLGKPVFADDNARVMTCKAWARPLADVPLELALLAVDTHAVANKYPPCVAEIVERVAKIQNPSMPIGGGDAWEMAMRIVKVWGATETRISGGREHYRRDVIGALPNAVQKTIRSIGYEELCRCQLDQQNTQRAQFMRIYETYAKREQDDAMLPTSLKQDAARFAVEEPTAKLLGAPVKDLAENAVEPTPEFKAAVEMFAKKMQMRNNSWCMGCKPGDEEQCNKCFGLTGDSKMPWLNTATMKDGETG